MIYFFIQYDKPTVCQRFNSRTDWLDFCSDFLGLMIQSERYNSQHMLNYGVVIKSKAGLKVVALDKENTADIRLSAAVMFITLK